MSVTVLQPAYNINAVCVGVQMSAVAKGIFYFLENLQLLHSLFLCLFPKVKASICCLSYLFTPFSGPCRIMSRTTSKFRHVFPTPAKTDGQFRDIKTSNTIWDCSNFVAANSKYLALAWAAGGGGKLAVINLENTVKIPSDVPCLMGHTGPILDWQFHPFADNLIATSSEDTTVRIWSIPDGGLTQNLDTQLITLSGHTKKVGICQFHHVAMNTLTTASMDHTVKLWDIEVGEKLTVDVHKDQIFSLSYCLEGNQFVTTSRDKSIRVVDPRSNAVAAEAKGHLGNKAQKAIWAKRQNKIITAGFGKMQDRQVYVW